MKISQLDINPENPRTIGEEEFAKLIKSIKDFPEMMKLRPIVVTPSKTKGRFVVIGGTMRYRALQALDYEEIPSEWVKIASDFTDEQVREFIIKDNVPAGIWDIDILWSNWSDIDLGEWGLDVPDMPPDIDYSILEDNGDKIKSQAEAMVEGVRKAIQIEFEAEDYEEAYALVSFWRKKEAYVGGMILACLRGAKEELEEL